MDWRIGRKFLVYSLVSFVGICVPRYVMAWGSQQKGKLAWHCVTTGEERGMFKAIDFVKLIWRLEIVLKRAKSLSKLGMVVMGSERNRRISPAYPAILHCLFFISMPLISGLALSLRRKGSMVSTKMRGERGQP